MKNILEKTWPLLGLIIAALIFQKFQEETIDLDEKNSLQESKTLIQGKRSVASKVIDQGGSGAQSSQDTLGHNSQSVQGQENEQQQISSFDPIMKILAKYKISPQSKLKVNHDEWFISDSYVQIHISQYVQGTGVILERHNNFYVIESSSLENAQDYPPLVISHATNRPIPITGDLLVKVENHDRIPESIDFLENDKVMSDFIKKVVVDQNLVEMRWLVVKLKRPSDVMKAYALVMEYVGQHNIETVNPDNLPEFKIR